MERVRWEVQSFPPLKEVQRLEEEEEEEEEGEEEEEKEEDDDEEEEEEEELLLMFGITLLQKYGIWLLFLFLS